MWDEYMYYTIEFRPSFCQYIEQISFSSHGILSSVTCGPSKQYYFGFTDQSNGMTESSLWNFPINFNFFNSLGSLNDVTCRCSLLRDCLWLVRPKCSGHWLILRRRPFSGFLLLLCHCLQLIFLTYLIFKLLITNLKISYLKA